MRPAMTAGYRLRVKTPVQDILIFFPAPWAHGEDVHGSLRAVVRDSPDDGKPRAAVGAVYKGIVDAVLLRLHIPEAISTNRDIWAHFGNNSFHMFTVPDMEVFRREGRDRFCLYLLNACCPGGFLLQGMTKIPRSSFIRIYTDHYTVAAVLHPAGQSPANSQAVYKRPEANSLDKAPDRYPECSILVPVKRHESF